MLDGSSTLEGLIVVNGDESWVDYEVETAVTIMSDSASNREASIVLRYLDAQNFYWLGLGCWGHKVCISRYVNGTPEPLVYSGVDEDIVFDHKYVLKAIVSGSILKLYLDGNLVLTYQDDSIPYGPAGLRVWGSHAQFDYLDAKEYGGEIVTNMTFSGVVSKQETAGETVTVVIEKDGVTVASLQAVTDVSGNYSVTEDIVAGSYLAVASIGADNLYEAAVSQPVVFNVGLEPRSITLNVS